MTDTPDPPKRGRGRPRKVPADASPPAPGSAQTAAERLRRDSLPSADVTAPRRAAVTLTAARAALRFRLELEQSAGELEELGEAAPLVRAEAFHARAAALSLLEQARTLLRNVPAEHLEPLEQARAELLGEALRLETPAGAA